MPSGSRSDVLFVFFWCGSWGRLRRTSLVIDFCLHFGICLTERILTWCQKESQRKVKKQRSKEAICFYLRLCVALALWLPNSPSANSSYLCFRSIVCCERIFGTQSETQIAPRLVTHTHTSSCSGARSETTIRPYRKRGRNGRTTTKRPRREKHNTK